MENWPEGEIPSFEKAWNSARVWPDTQRQRSIEKFENKFKERFGVEPDHLWLMKEQLYMMKREWGSDPPYTIEGVFEMVVTKKMRGREIGERISQIINGYMAQPYASYPGDVIQFVVLFAFFHHLDKCHDNWLLFNSQWVNEEVARIARFDRHIGLGFVKTFIGYFASERANSPYGGYLLVPEELDDGMGSDCE